jgi:integrating conjugative element protein (TIGR03765 family)
MKPYATFLAGALVSTTAPAVPVVIYDSGKTQPLSRYLAAIKTEVPRSRIRLPQTVTPSLENLPVRTPEMTPGAVIARHIDQPHLSRPLFLVGNDDRSKRWLEHYREKLIEAQAVGMVIDVETKQELDELKRIGKGLQLVAAPGTQLAKQLGIAHYPVLISKSRIEQ